VGEWVKLATSSVCLHSVLACLQECRGVACRKLQYRIIAKKRATRFSKSAARNVTGMNTFTVHAS